jgi:hypothetical protein
MMTLGANARQRNRENSDADNAERQNVSIPFGGRPLESPPHSILAEERFVPEKGLNPANYLKAIVF